MRKVLALPVAVTEASSAVRSPGWSATFNSFGPVIRAAAAGTTRSR